MDKRTKERAIELLVAKRSNPSISYADIGRKTGYSRHQLMRLPKRVEQLGPVGAAAHSNAGHRHATAATDDEIRYLRKFKEPYRSITIAQFRDIFIEDVIENPDRRDDVERYGLVARSRSWFRELFRREGWRSPAQRPERFNLTGQLRLVNDIIRFGIEDYDHLDPWFSELYVDHLNRKLSFPPAEPGSEFRRMPEDFDYSSVFRIRLTRISRGGMISYEMGLYRMVDGDGVLYDPGGGVRVNLFIDAWTEEMHVERYGKRYECVPCGVREHRNSDLAGNQGELQDLLRKMR